MTTFRHLKIFVTVAECGTIRKAAEVLYISQPSVSQAIQELEEYYGIKLFDRLSRRIYITEAGKLLLSYAQQMIRLTEAMDETMKQASSAPILRIGGSVTIHNTSIIEQLVLTSELDFAIVEGSITNEELIQHIVCEEKL